MAEQRNDREGGNVRTTRSPQRDPAKKQHRSKTEGTNRDFDESGEADNQAHGHPREERGRGVSERTS